MLFNVPGSDARKLEKATERMDVDLLVLDLEDGVAANRKQEARELVRKSLSSLSDVMGGPQHGSLLGRHVERCVRMNHIGSGLERDDLQHCIVPSLAKLDSVLLPKVEAPCQLQELAAAVTESIPAGQSLAIIAAIESAKGIVNLKEICATQLPENTPLSGLVYASEDLCADMGITRSSTRHELLYTRGAVVAHAKAFQLDAIDLVCIDFRDMDRLEEEASEGAAMGYTGKQAIHPGQVEVIAKAFSPSPEKAEWARRIVKGFEEHSRAGAGAYSLDGVMIDMPMVKWAQKVLLQVQDV